MITCIRMLRTPQFPLSNPPPRPPPAKKKMKKSTRGDHLFIRVASIGVYFKRKTTRALDAPGYIKTDE